MAYLTDGFPTIINMSSGQIAIKEKEVTPPSASAGGPNDTTTMRNTRFRTRQPKKLITFDKVSVKAAYDSAIFGQIAADLGVNQQMTVIFPDTHQITVWAWLDEIKPDAAKEGEQPTVEVTFVCSNQDNSNNEVAPVYS